MSSSEYIPEFGDKVRVIGYVWEGYVGKVISVSHGSDGSYRGARILNPSFRERGHHCDSYWFSKGRLEKIE